MTSTLFEVTVLHDEDNLSDHDPIILVLNVNIPILNQTEKISWPKASDADIAYYGRVLTEIIYPK